MLFVEPIENRCYMAATFKLLRGILSVSGTAGLDAISVGAGANSFEVVANGDTRTFNSSDVGLIRIYGGDGDDQLIVSPRQKTSVLIEAGRGNDLVGGGSNNDTLLGEF